MEETIWLAGSGGVIVALVGHGLRYPHVYDARLDHDAAVRDVYLQDFLHPGHYYENAGLDGQRAAGEAGARAAGHERYPFLVAEPDGLLDLLGALGDDDEVRYHPVFHEAVALVGA